MNHTKDKYKEFCAHFDDLPIFYHSWYLDQVTSDGSWDVSLYEHEGKVIAAWPYFIKRKLGFKYITMPPLTPYLGPIYHLADKILKKTSRRSFEHKVQQRLENQIPSVLLSTCHLHPKVGNALPLFWKGYHLNTRYTNRLDLVSDADSIWAGLSHKQRNRIKSAEVSHVVIESDEIEEFHKMNVHTFKKQGLECPYSINLLKNLDSALLKKKSRKIYFALDNENIKRAAIYIVYDKRTAYCLAIARDTETHSGCVSLLLWHAIRSCLEKGYTTFDFEGSMIEPIERFFRSFGGTIVPYIRIVKVKTKWQEILLRALGKI